MARKPPSGPGGLIVVDKPSGMTSHDVVAKVRRIAGTRKVGHAGTLDPMATGVLVVGVERSTKLLNHLLLTDKTYEATIRLGARTTTEDADGELVDETDASGLTADRVEAAMAALTGTIDQRPSSVSAIKVDGKRAYDLVRAGHEVTLDSRQIDIGRFELVAGPRALDRVVDVDVLVDCSSGTYVRALARDLGDALGVGGHLTRLRRTRVGRFTLEHARTLEQLTALAENASPILLPLPEAIAVEMDTRTLSAHEATELTFGRYIDGVGMPGIYGGLAEDGHAVALLTEEAGRARPILGFTPAGS